MKCFYGRRRRTVFLHKWCHHKWFLMHFDVKFHPFPINSQYLKTLWFDSPAYSLSSWCAFLPINTSINWPVCKYSTSVYYLTKKFITCPGPCWIGQIVQMAELEIVRWEEEILQHVILCSFILQHVQHVIHFATCDSVWVATCVEISWY